MGRFNLMQYGAKRSAFGMVVCRRNGHSADASQAGLATLWQVATNWCMKEADIGNSKFVSSALQKHINSHFGFFNIWDVLRSVLQTLLNNQF